MSVQVQFLEASLAIVSVPLDKYPLVFHGVVKLALGTWKSKSLSDDENAHDRDNLRQGHSESEDNFAEDFFSISITPNECSIICREELIDVVFGADYLGSIPGVAVLPRRYAAIKVDSAGVESGNERIHALSSSLSAAQIPIFFLSTYFSDYMLVPGSVQHTVRSLLETSNYVFSSMENSYISLHRTLSGSTSSLSALSHGTGDRSRSTSPALPGSIHPLQKYDLHPTFDCTELLITGPRQHTDLDCVELAVVRILAREPRYFSITKYGDEIALIIECTDAELFPTDSLLGPLSELYVPITLDLRQVPVDVVGVVAEISSKLEEKNIPMSFLSTAKTSTVLVSRDNSWQAEALCS